MKIFSRLRSVYVFIPFLMICSMPVAPVLAVKCYKNCWDKNCEATITQLPDIFRANFSSLGALDACKNIMSNVRPKLKEANPPYTAEDIVYPCFESSFNAIVTILHHYEASIKIDNKESYDIVNQWYTFLNRDLTSAFFFRYDSALRYEQFKNYLSSLQAKIQAYGVQLQELAVQRQFSIVSENVIHINKYLVDINQFVSSNGQVTKEQMHFLLVKFPLLQCVFNQSINPLVNESEQINSFTRISNNERVKMVNDSTSLLNHIRSLFSGVIQDGYDSAIPENKNGLLVFLNEGFQNIDFIKHLIIREFTERINQFINVEESIKLLSGTLNLQDEAENVKNFIVEVISMLYSHGKNRPGLDIDGVITEIINYCAQMFFTIDRNAFLTVRDTLIDAIIQLTYKLSREGAKLDNVIIMYPAPMLKPQNPIEKPHVVFDLSNTKDKVPSVSNEMPNYPPPFKEIQPDTDVHPAPMLKPQNQDDKKSDSLTGFPPPPPAPTPKPVLIDVPQEKVSKDEKARNSFFTAGQQGAKSACLLF